MFIGPTMAVVTHMNSAAPRHDVWFGEFVDDAYRDAAFSKHKGCYEASWARTNLFEAE